MQDHVFTLNNFDMPLVFKDTNAEYMLIARLLLLDPGKFQSHPSMGIGLRSKYRFRIAPDIIFDLKKDIQNQINTFLPEIKYTGVELDMLDGGILNIIIKTVEGNYGFSYDNANDKLSIGHSNLNNL